MVLQLRYLVHFYINGCKHLNVIYPYISMHRMKKHVYMAIMIHRVNNKRVFMGTVPSFILSFQPEEIRNISLQNEIQWLLTPSFAYMMMYRFMHWTNTKRFSKPQLISTEFIKFRYWYGWITVFYYIIIVVLILSLRLANNSAKCRCNSLLFCLFMSIFLWLTVYLWIVNRRSCSLN